jgi:hypothetical protein
MPEANSGQKSFFQNLSYPCYDAILLKNNLNIKMQKITENTPQFDRWHGATTYPAPKLYEYFSASDQKY